MIAHWDDAPSRRRELGPLTSTWSFLGEAAGSATIGVRRMQVDPGKLTTPVHVHGAEEEIFFVLQGSGLSWQDGSTYEVRADDCLVHLAETEAHTLRAGEEALDVLAFGQRLQTEHGVLPRAGVMWAPGGRWIELAPEPSPWEREVAAGELEFGEPRARPDWIVSLADVAEQDVGRGGSHYHVRDLGRAAGSAKTGLKHYTLAPGQLGPPPHCHSAEEELFVILGGEGTLMLLEHPGTRVHPPVSTHATEEHEVRRGHVVSRPAGTRVAHAFRAGEGGLSYLAYGTREASDIAYYPRSGKVYLRGVGVLGRITQLEYWDGEE